MRSPSWADGHTGSLEVFTFNKNLIVIQWWILHFVRYHTYTGQPSLALKNIYLFIYVTISGSIFIEWENFLLSTGTFTVRWFKRKTEWILPEYSPNLFYLTLDGTFCCEIKHVLSYFPCLRALNYYIFITSNCKKELKFNLAAEFK